MAPNTRFEAAVMQVFEIPGRGTVLGVEIRAGIVVVGDRVVIPCSGDDVRTTEVRSVEYIDGCEPPLPLTLVGLVVEGIRPDEVAIGGTIRGTLRP